MKKKIGAALLGAAAAFLLTGCGTSLYELTETEEDIIVNYAAHVVSKYNTYQQDGLTRVDVTALEEEELSETEEPEDTETADNGEDAGQSETAGTTEDTETAEEPEDGSQSMTMEELFSQTGLTVSYTGYELAESYTEGDMFSVQQFSGKQYLICSFLIQNQTDGDIELDNYSEGFTFRVSYTDDGGSASQASQYSTIMTNDFSTYMETIPAGEEKSAVLLFQIPDSVTEVSDLTLFVKRNGTTYEIKL